MPAREAMDVWKPIQKKKKGTKKSKRVCMVAFILTALGSLLNAIPAKKAR